MTEKKPKTIIRKLALPLEFTMGNDSVASDGFFRLNKAYVSKIIVKSIDSDGYAICELIESEKISLPQRIPILEATLIGGETSRSRGRGGEIGQYKYFERPDGYIYAEVAGKRNRRIHLGSIRDRTSKISIVIQTIAQNFHIGREFDRKQLTKVLPKHLTYGQTLKSLLDVLKIKGYLDIRETKYKGRPYERYIPTEKIFKLRPVNMSKWVKVSSEQA